MNSTSKPLSAAAIHSVYAGASATRAVDPKKAFKSTSQFDRDPAHTGRAPEAPKASKGPFRR